MTNHWKKPRRRGVLARARWYPVGIAVMTAVVGLTTLNSCTSPEVMTPTATVTMIPSDIDRQRDADRRRRHLLGRFAERQHPCLALDAPETSQAGGSAATGALARLISGQTLKCRQRDIDRYGRIAGQCFLADGRDITAAMIASGTAQEYNRFSSNHYRTC